MCWYQDCGLCKPKETETIRTRIWKLELAEGNIKEKAKRWDGHKKSIHTDRYSVIPGCGLYVFTEKKGSWPGGCFVDCILSFSSLNWHPLKIMLYFNWRLKNEHFKIFQRSD
jgi:hypothetical protein